MLAVMLAHERAGYQGVAPDAGWRDHEPARVTADRWTAPVDV
jgi:hypothetical protein